MNSVTQDTVLVGLDFHHRSIQACITDCKGEILLNRRCENSVSEVPDAIRAVRVVAVRMHIAHLRRRARILCRGSGSCGGTHREHGPASVAGPSWICRALVMLTGSLSSVHLLVQQVHDVSAPPARHGRRVSRDGRETPANSLRLEDERLDRRAEAFIVYRWVGGVSPIR